MCLSLMRRAAACLQPVRLLTLTFALTACGALELEAGTVFGSKADWKYLKGRTEASQPDTSTWRHLNFSDQSWSLGVTPFYYGEPLSGTFLDDMQGNYTCIFLRRTFQIQDPQAIDELRFGVLSDDGFIAWINGVEVLRYNMPSGGVPFNGLSLSALQEPIPFETHSLTIPAPSSYLLPGTNVIAVQAFNTSLGNSSDFVFDASLETVLDEQPPIIQQILPPRNARLRQLLSIEVAFDEPVLGVEAEDLFVNGQPATTLVQWSPQHFEFQFPEPAAGTVQVAWRTDHAITDSSPARNAFTGGSWTYTVDPNLPAPQVEISEFLADNDRGLRDEDGDEEDWIELHNPTDRVANLYGWYLTDQTNALTQWRFPNVSIEPSGYLIIFASEKNRTNPAAPLHTNFKLEKNGEFLALVKPDGSLATAFSPQYPEQFTDVAFGLDAADPQRRGYFPTPTPGSANQASGPGFAPRVQFSRSGGTFVDAFTLSLTPADSGANVRYTTDGTLPTESSALYTKPITITNSIQVRARAFASELLPGPIRTETYIALNPALRGFTSDLPLMILHNLGRGGFPAGGDLMSYTAVFEPKFGRSSLTNAPDLDTRAGVNIRGSSTLGLPKQSFSVEFWDEYDQDRDLAPVGLPADSDWVLYAPNNFEPILIHNPFLFQISRDIGSYAPRTRFVELYVNTSGGPLTSSHYVGVYVLIEKIKRGPHRVDFAKLEPEHQSEPSVTGGYMLKIDRLDPGDSGLSAGGQFMGFVDPKEREIRLPQRDAQERYIQNYLNAFGSALNSPNFSSPTLGFRAYVDIDSWIDHHILNVMAFNVDALRLSSYFYKPRGGKLKFGPIWDFDRALGSTDGRDANPRIWRSAVSDRGTDFFNYPWWGRMFQDIDFWQRWIDRWQELRQPHREFGTFHLHQVIDQMTAQLREAQVREATRWPSLTRPRGGSYQYEIDYLKSWLSNRINFIDTNFLAPPTFSAPGHVINPGFEVALRGPSGATVYYTTNGTDPRLPGGNISPGATAAARNVVLDRTTVLTARSYHSNHRNLTGPNNPPLSSPWSGAVVQRYALLSYPGELDLAVSEIDYHPAPPSAAEAALNRDWTDNDFEFIELHNRSSRTLDLYACRFVEGIQFDFTNSTIPELPAGAQLLLVRNPGAFHARHGARTNIAGTFGGGLDDAGETLDLRNGYHEPVFRFRYSDAWYPITDGHGFSLVHADPKGPNLETASAWRVSAQSGGSPGAPDPTPQAVPRIVVNEALTHTDPPQIDAFELYNPATEAADISGWLITDDFDKPSKFILPPGTILLPDAYRTFTEEDLRTAGGGTPPFLLNATGDQLFLFSADSTGRLTGYLHGFSFGASANGISFGLHLSRDGHEHFVAQSANSLGQPNAGPRIGPVIISEIMYHPPDLVVGTNRYDQPLNEFIELQNLTPQTQALFDPNHPTNAWRVRGEVEFDLPAAISLAPDSRLLLVNFNPSTDASQTQRFRNLYAVPAEIALLGPYRGKLGNDSGSIRLLRPDAPQPPPAADAGNVPFILVDEVGYQDMAPWPSTADGQGDSLQRAPLNAFGNDPFHWIAAHATAGTRNPQPTPVDADNDGLPDDWERAYGLDPTRSMGDDGPTGDPDRDQATNLAEYIAGTHPRDPSSFLQLRGSRSLQSQVLLAFDAVAGKAYSIWYRDELTKGSWQTLQDLDPQTQTRRVEVLDPTASARIERYYRLVTPRKPPP